ncbi:sugar kinase [Rubellimicrobium roseum]|uniref:Sugar kinase n=1 Tax=Rubellimicrobium roseum TaxID=687525 RepID=A0A5C4NDQ1_9RHOB|nr:sugar kinase [Rubellimicrobium roseum]TNC72242.1 sugar kinase [Rubellimicrobium roseum]
MASGRTRQARVLVIGEILVEIMATTPGHGFRQALDLRGPFPSGAPAIFADQLARQGVPVALVSCVGDDDFGRLNLDRLREAGVDTGAIRVHPTAVTGSAFVRYRPEGGRDFFFNIADSACGRIARDAASDAVVEGATHLHVMGSSLSTPAIVELVLDALTRIKAKGGTVSFDPNIRPELLGHGDMRATLDRVLDATDLFLPSEGEAAMFAGTPDDVSALPVLFGRGVRAVAMKLGTRGSRLVSPEEDVSMPGFVVREVDPTGAGDTFGATFLAAWLGGLPAREALARANAAGALAVTRLGPMEGASDPARIDAFLAAQRNV